MEAMQGRDQIEKFSPTELANLRSELLQSSLDSWQAAEVVTNFLSGRGYGVSTLQVRDAMSRLEGINCPVECMQAVLEQVAYVM
jgi:hypothetical protein